MVRFLRRQNVQYPIVVADSSDPKLAAQLRTLCPPGTDIRSSDSNGTVVDKFIAAVDGVETPLAVLLPDDDVTFLHAIEQCAKYLNDNPDAVAAHGYVLDFGIHENTFDIVRVRWFTPTVGEDDPLQRLYHLLRRYQPFMWAVFRKQTLLTALRRSKEIGLIVLQEMTIMGTAALYGKVARLPCIYSLRGMEESLSPLSQTNPFFSLIDNSDNFFTHYGRYQELLTQFIERDIRPISCPPGQLRHTLNLIHVISFGLELDLGTTNYTVEKLLGAPHPPVKVPRQWVGWRDPRAGDVYGPPDTSGRRCLWRKEMLEAEPHDEINITAKERKLVESALHRYSLTPA
jgi:glycosyltransferase domain-containing protein